jgi:hypothetical protein
MLKEEYLLAQFVMAYKDVSYFMLSFLLPDVIC